jgi:hypothetical protein
MNDVSQIPYVHDYITKLCRQQSQIMKIHTFEILDNAEPNTENKRGINLAAVKHMTVKVKNFRCNRSYS